MMPQGNVGQVEQRRLVRSARVHDLEDGLQIPIQVNDRTYLSLEHEGIISPIPPSMGYASRQVHALAGPCISALAADHRRQGAGGNQPFLILKVMNVQRGAVAMRRQRASQLKDEFPSLLLPPKLEDLAGVAVLQSEIAHRGETHRCSRSKGMPNALRFRCEALLRPRQPRSRNISCGGRSG
jgi:hypothetical protein